MSTNPNPKPTPRNQPKATPPKAKSKTQPKTWFWIAGVFALVAGIIAVVMIARGTSVRDHVDDTYARASNLDQDEEIAYTTTAAPSVVTAGIVNAWKPVSQYADASGVYLRYNDDMVLVRPHNGGSVIRVDDIDRAYRRYHSHVGGNWGWTSGHGESFRGRGPGAGK